MVVIVSAMMSFFYRLANEHRCQVRKDEGLDKGYQHLNHVNEHRKANRDGRKAPTNAFAHITKDEDQGDQTDNDNVTCQHVGKKTYDQGKGLSKDGKDLYRHHDELNTERHRRIENVSPVVFITAEGDYQEGDNTKGSRKGNVTGYVGGTWNQSEYVVD
jgi:hypothetical protein